MNKQKQQRNYHHQRVGHDHHDNHLCSARKLDQVSPSQDAGVIRLEGGIDDDAAIKDQGLVVQGREEAGVDPLLAVRHHQAALHLVPVGKDDPVDPLR